MWTAIAESILAKLQRLCKAINGTSHFRPLTIGTVRPRDDPGSNRKAGSKQCGVGAYLNIGRKHGFPPQYSQIEASDFECR